MVMEDVDDGGSWKKKMHKSGRGRREWREKKIRKKGH